MNQSPQKTAPIWVNPAGYNDLRIRKAAQQLELTPEQLFTRLQRLFATAAYDGRVADGGSVSIPVLEVADALGLSSRWKDVRHALCQTKLAERSGDELALDLGDLLSVDSPRPPASWSW